jgi:DivIVA domain-containing protein
MRKRGVEEPHFPLVRRGYDPAQVDGYLAAHARWGSEAWVRIQQLEAEVSELRNLVDSLQGERASLAAKRAREHEIQTEHRVSEIVQAAEARAAKRAEGSRREEDENLPIGEDPRGHG